MNARLTYRISGDGEEWSIHTPILGARGTLSVMAARQVNSRRRFRTSSAGLMLTTRVLSIHWSGIMTTGTVHLLIENTSLSKSMDLEQISRVHHRSTTAFGKIAHERRLLAALLSSNQTCEMNIILYMLPLHASLGITTPHCVNQTSKIVQAGYRYSELISQILSFRHTITNVPDTVEAATPTQAADWTLT